MGDEAGNKQKRNEDKEVENDSDRRNDGAQNIIEKEFKNKFSDESQ